MTLPVVFCSSWRVRDVALMAVTASIGAPAVNRQRSAFGFQYTRCWVLVTYVQSSVTKFTSQPSIATVRAPSFSEAANTLKLSYIPWGIQPLVNGAADEADTMTGEYPGTSSPDNSSASLQLTSSSKEIDNRVIVWYSFTWREMKIQRVMVTLTSSQVSTDDTSKRIGLRMGSPLLWQPTFSLITILQV